MSECRRACIAAQTNATMAVGPCVGGWMEETPRAEALTGDRRHFWLKPHGTTGSQHSQSGQGRTPTMERGSVEKLTVNRNDGYDERTRSSLGSAPVPKPDS